MGRKSPDFNKIYIADPDEILHHGAFILGLPCLPWCPYVSIPYTKGKYFLNIQSSIWASTRENLSSGNCEERRCRPACASAQTDQGLCYLLIRKFHI